MDIKFLVFVVCLYLWKTELQPIFSHPRLRALTADSQKSDEVRTESAKLILNKYLEGHNQLQREMCYLLLPLLSWYKHKLL